MSKLDKALIGQDELDDPRLLELERGVRLLHVEALAWSARHRTDGVVSEAALRRFTDEPDVVAAAQALVDVGLWSETDDGWQLPWDQLKAADAARIQAGNRARWEKYKERQARHRADDHSMCSDRYCLKANGVGNAVGNGVLIESDLTGSDRNGGTPTGVPTDPYNRRREGAALARGELARSAPSQAHTSVAYLVARLRNAGVAEGHLLNIRDLLRHLVKTYPPADVEECLRMALEYGKFTESDAINSDVATKLTQMHPDIPVPMAVAPFLRKQPVPVGTA